MQTKANNFHGSPGKQETAEAPKSDSETPISPKYHPETNLLNLAQDSNKDRQNVLQYPLQQSVPSLEQLCSHLLSSLLQSVLSQ